VDRLLPMFLGRLIRRGSFTVTTGAGKTYTFGDGSGPPVVVHFTAAKSQRAVILDPELRLGEAYMDGTFVVQRGTTAEVLGILFGQELIAAPNWAVARLLRYLFRRLQQFNPRFRARNNVAHQLFVTAAAGRRIVWRVPPTQGCRQEWIATINGWLRRAVSSGESRKQGFPRRRRSTNDRVCVVACGVCGRVPLSLSDPRC
jgi:hypothetical protein